MSTASLDLNLPDCLVVRSDGAIVVRGHRISLALIAEAWLAGETLAQVGERFPSLSRDELRAVVEFCQVNPAAIRSYYKDYKRKEAAFFVEENRGPSLSELRNRPKSGSPRDN